MSGVEKIAFGGGGAGGYRVFLPLVAGRRFSHSFSPSPSLSLSLSLLSLSFSLRRARRLDRWQMHKYIY
jgi:hypothetical protein